MNFIKTTILGGMVFLVPVSVFGYTLFKVFGLMMVLAEPMADIIPVDSIAGFALANIIAAAVVLLICFGAGLVARAGPVTRLANRIEDMILSKLPGYSLLKGLTGSLSPEENARLHPVLVTFEASKRLGLETESVDDEHVAVYFPGSTNARSGVVHIVTRSQAERLDISVSAVI